MGRDESAAGDSVYDRLQPGREEPDVLPRSRPSTRSHAAERLRPVETAADLEKLKAFVNYAPVESISELGCWQRVKRLLLSRVTHKSERSRMSPAVTSYSRRTSSNVFRTLLHKVPF